MTYDEDLAHRVRELLGAHCGVEEKRMFGGLMVRVPADDMAALLRSRHVEPMVMGGREFRGWLLVAADGVRDKRRLQPWVSRGVAYARSLPPK